MKKLDRELEEMVDRVAGALTVSEKDEPGVQVDASAGLAKVRGVKKGQVVSPRHLIGIRRRAREVLDERYWTRGQRTSIICTVNELKLGAIFDFCAVQYV